MGFTCEEKEKIRNSSKNFNEEYKKAINEWRKMGKYTADEVEDLAYATLVLSNVGVTPEQYGIIYNAKHN